MFIYRKDTKMQNVTQQHPISAGHLHQIHPDTLGAGVVQEATQLWELEDHVNAGIRENSWLDEVARQKIDPRLVGLGQRAVIRVLGLTRGEDPLLRRHEVERSDKVVTDYREGTMDDYLRREKDTRESLDGKVDELRGVWLKLEGKNRKGFDAELYEAMDQPQRDELLAWEDDPAHEGLDAIDWMTEAPHKAMPANTRRERRLRDEQKRQDNDRIITFLAVHNRDIAERQQDPHFLAEVAREKTEWKEGVERGVEEGWLHPYALTRLHEINELEIYEGDAFSTLLRHRIAYVKRKGGGVIIGPGAVKDSSKHEFDHAALQTWSSDPDNIFSLPWVFEPTTEEITLTQNGKPFDKLDLSIGSYNTLRGLIRDSIEVAMSYGAEVSFSDFTLGYSAPEHEQIARSREIKRSFSLIPIESKNFFDYVAKDLVNNFKALEGFEVDGVILNLNQRKKMAAEQTTLKVRSLANPNSVRTTS